MVKKTTISLSLIIAGIFAAKAFSQQPLPNNSRAINNSKAHKLGKTHNVEIKVISFSPKKITIHTGDTVRWRNTSPIVHTVTADPSLATIKGSALLPKNAKPFNSKEIKPDGVFEHKFKIPGVYKYFCIPHEAAMMRGEITVIP